MNKIYQLILAENLSRKVKTVKKLTIHISYCIDFILHCFIKEKKIIYILNKLYINWKIGAISFQNMTLTFRFVYNYFLCVFRSFFSLNLYVWKYLNFSITFYIENNDLRLLNRDLLLLVINLLNIKKLNFSIENKFTSILRSPFVYNKIREQFKINFFRVQFRNLIQTNLLIDNYYFDLRFDKLYYSLLKLWKQLL